MSRVVRPVEDKIGNNACKAILAIFMWRPVVALIRDLIFGLPAITFRRGTKAPQTERQHILLRAHIPRLLPRIGMASNVLESEHARDPRASRIGRTETVRSSAFRLFLIMAIATMLLSATLVQRAFAEGSSPVSLGYVDNYDKSVEPGSAVSYNWTVTNPDWNQTFRVDVFVSGSDTAWTLVVNRDFVTLAPTDTWTVTLTVFAPPTQKSGQLVVQVLFRVTNATEGWNLAAFPVITRIVESPLVMGLFENPLPPPLDGKYGVFLLDVAIWTLIVVAVYEILELFLRRITKRTKTHVDDIVFGIVRLPLLTLLILLGIVESLDVLGLPLGFSSIISKVYYVIMVLVLAYVAYKIFRDVVIYYGKLYATKTQTQIDDVVIPLAEKVGAVVIVVIAVAVLMSYVGLDLTILAVGSIVVSMVIAFALQDTLSNFFSGIYLLTDRPFKAGELIVLETGDVCRVERIGMRSTRLYKIFEHTIMIVPNNRLANERIVNIVQPDQLYKIVVKVGVAYGTNTEQVVGILKEIALRHPRVLRDADKAPVVRLLDLGESSLQFILSVWIDNVYNQWAVASDLREAILREFAATGIEIPFPQRVIWTRSLGNQGLDKQVPSNK